MKYDVAVYLGTLPKIKNRSTKIDILNDFAEGAKRAGANVIVTTDRTVQSSKLAVMIGWYGQKISGPHIQFRKHLIDHQQQTGSHIMPIDGNCFKWADSDDIWLRYSLGSVFYDEGNYANCNPDKQRWRDVSKTLGIHCDDWKSGGKHILLCLQRDNGWQGKGFDQQQWVQETIVTLRQHTDRPIRLRCHPGSISDTSAFVHMPGVSVSDCRGTGIMDDLKNAHAGVFYNSSSSVACALAGIPVFVGERSAVTWNIANKNLHDIENPKTPDRQQWLWSLAEAHWSRQQSKSGDIYKKFASFLI